MEATNTRTNTTKMNQHQSAGSQSHSKPKVHCTAHTSATKLQLLQQTPPQSTSACWSPLCSIFAATGDEQAAGCTRPEHLQTSHITPKDHRRILQQLTAGVNSSSWPSASGCSSQTTLPAQRPWLAVDSLHAALLLLLLLTYLRACWLLQEPQPLLLLLPICLLLLKEEPRWHPPHPQLLLKQALLKLRTACGRRQPWLLHIQLLWQANKVALQQLQLLWLH
jgi:hypothetical protein